MKNLGMLLTSIVLSGFFSTSALAESVCISYWPWGGCAQWENYSTLSGNQGSSRGYDRIYFKNNCSRNVYTAIHYKDMSGNWTTQGWWNQEPNQKIYVAQTKNTTFYVHAQTSDPLVNRLVWQGEDYYDNVRGGQDAVGFKKVKSSATKWVDYTYSFNCDGISKYKAIALSWNSKGAWATRIRNHTADAKNAALEACNNNSTTSCSLGLDVSPNSFGCLSLAGSGRKMYSSRNSNKNTAINRALSNCRANNNGCTTLWTGCNL